MPWLTTLHSNNLKASLILLIISLICAFILGFIVLKIGKAEQIDYGTKWVDPYTKTTWIRGSPSNTIIYSFPQVVYGGEQYVEYVYERVGQNEFWVQCPTSAFNIRSAITEVWNPQRTEMILSKSIWQLWFFNGTEWNKIKAEDSKFSVVENIESIEISQKRNMTDGSLVNITWTFTNIAKYTIDFQAGQTGNYSVTWHIEIPKASNYTITENSLTFYDVNKFLAYLNYYDAKMYFNAMSIEPLGQTGRKATITFANRTFQVGDKIRIDPTTSTFNSEASRDGRIVKSGNSFPPTSMQHYTGESFVRLENTYFSSLNQYDISRIFFSFNTSSIDENATISGAYLKVKSRRDSRTDDWNFNVLLYSGYYGSLGTDDWNKCNSSEGIFIHSSDVNSRTYYQKDVSISSINTTGLSQYKFVIDKENQPSGANNIEWFMGDSPNHPQLIVTYKQPEEEPPASLTPITETPSFQTTPTPTITPRVEKLPIIGLWFVVGGVGLFTISAIIKKLTTTSRRGKPRGVHPRRSPTRRIHKPKRSKRTGRFIR